MRILSIRLFSAAIAVLSLATVSAASQVVLPVTSWHRGNVAVESFETSGNTATVEKTQSGQAVRFYGNIDSGSIGFTNIGDSISLEGKVLLTVANDGVLQPSRATGALRWGLLDHTTGDIPSNPNNYQGWSGYVANNDAPLVLPPAAPDGRSLLYQRSGSGVFTSPGSTEWTVLTESQPIVQDLAYDFLLKVTLLPDDALSVTWALSNVAAGGVHDFSATIVDPSPSLPAPFNFTRVGFQVGPQFNDQSGAPTVFAEFSDVNVVFTPVPEPTTGAIALIGSAVVAGAAFRRRMRS